jgi:hypothetical protein
MRARDTDAASHAVQLAVYRSLGSAGRAKLAAKMAGEAREIARAGIRARHPDYSPEDLDFALSRLLYGDDLFRRAWPGRPLLAP